MKSTGRWFFLLSVMLPLLVASGCGSPAIMRAAACGNTAEVRSFLQEGADVNTVHRGWTPLLVALQWHRSETARLLIESGA
jgi:ankyrin repeat protein